MSSQVAICNVSLNSFKPGVHRSVTKCAKFLVSKLFRTTFIRCGGSYVCVISCPFTLYCSKDPLCLVWWALGYTRSLTEFAFVLHVSHTDKIGFSPSNKIKPWSEPHIYSETVHELYHLSVWKVWFCVVEAVFSEIVGFVHISDSSVT